MASHTIGSTTAHTKNTPKMAHFGCLVDLLYTQKDDAPKKSKWNLPTIPKGIFTWCSVLMIQLVRTLKWKTTLKPVLGPKLLFLLLLHPYTFLTPIVA
jgi:hypothetical protein